MYVIICGNRFKMTLSFFLKLLTWISKIILVTFDYPLYMQGVPKVI